MSRPAPDAFDTVKTAASSSSSPSSSSSSRQSGLQRRRRRHRHHRHHPPPDPIVANRLDPRHHPPPGPPPPPSHAPRHQQDCTERQQHKRLLLPPLPSSSTPRKRCRMNPYFTPIPNTPFFSAPLQTSAQQPQVQNHSQPQPQSHPHPQPHLQSYQQPPAHQSQSVLHHDQYRHHSQLEQHQQHLLTYDQLPNLTSVSQHQHQLKQSGLQHGPFAMSCSSNPASASAYTLHPHAHLYSPMLSQQQHISYHPHPQHPHGPPPVYTTSYPMPQSHHHHTALPQPSCQHGSNSTNTAHDRKPDDMVHSVLHQSNFATPSSTDGLAMTPSMLLLPPPSQSSAPSLPLPVPLSVPLSLPLPMSLQVPLSLPPLAENANSQMNRHVQSQLQAQAQSHIHSFAQSLTQKPLTQAHQPHVKVDAQQQQQRLHDFANAASQNDQSYDTELNNPKPGSHQSQPSFLQHDRQHPHDSSSWLSDHERLNYSNQYHHYPQAHAYPPQHQQQGVAQNNFINWLSDSSSTYDGTSRSYVHRNVCGNSSGNAIIDAHLRAIQQKPSNILSSHPIPASACSSMPASQQQQHSQLAIPSVSIPIPSSASVLTSTAYHGDVELGETHPSLWNRDHGLNFRLSGKRMRVGAFENKKENLPSSERVSKLAKTGDELERETIEANTRSGIDGGDSYYIGEKTHEPYHIHQYHVFNRPVHRVDNRIHGEDVNTIDTGRRHLDGKLESSGNERRLNTDVKGHVIENDALSEREALTTTAMVPSGSEVAVLESNVRTTAANPRVNEKSTSIVDHKSLIDVATKQDTINGTTTVAAATNAGGITTTESGIGRSTGAVVTRIHGKAVKSRDDRNGHLVFKLGEGLYAEKDFPNGRYKILNELGEGTFGKVVECWDRLELRRVAIKVVRSINKYRQAARLEIDVLLHLNVNDPRGLYHCVKLHSWFEFHSHVCMVFEKLGPSLYDHLRRNHFRPFTLDQVRDYAFQLLESVNFVHSLTLIHTDLKPENILLASAKDKWSGARPNTMSKQQQEQQCVHSCQHRMLANERHHQRHGVLESGSQNGDTTMSENSSAGGTAGCANGCMCGQRCCGWMNNPIKLIDFGSATYEAHHHSQLISTRHYRAPEVILGLGWTYPCDLWSIGCILVELYTGQALFQTHENLEHLAMMSHVLGPIPDSMIRRTAGQQGQKYFRNKGGRKLLNWPGGATSKSSVHSVRSVQSLDRLIPRETGHDEFRDLVKKLLAFEPNTRYTTSEALRHPFFRNMTHCHAHGGTHGHGQHVWSPRSGAMHMAWDASAGLMSGGGGGTGAAAGVGKTTAHGAPTAGCGKKASGGVVKVASGKEDVADEKAGVTMVTNSNVSNCTMELMSTSTTARPLVNAKVEEDTGTVGKSRGVGIDVEEDEEEVDLVVDLVKDSSRGRCDEVKTVVLTATEDEGEGEKDDDEEEVEVEGIGGGNVMDVKVDVAEIQGDETQAGVEDDDEVQKDMGKVAVGDAQQEDGYVDLLNVNKNNCTLPVVGDVATNNTRGGTHARISSAPQHVTQQVW